MKRKALILILFLTSLFFLQPINTNARTGLKKCEYDDNVRIVIYDDLTAEATKNGNAININNWRKLVEAYKKNNNTNIDCPKYAIDIKNVLFIANDRASAQKEATKNSTRLLELTKNKVADPNEALDEWLKNANNTNMECTGENSLLGDPNDEDSLAWLIKYVLDIARFAGPILVLVFTSIDYIRALIQSDDETMGKINKKLTTRILLAILLFCVPQLVYAVLDLFGLTASKPCGLE